MTGEKGEQGDKGNTGSTGATGPAGPAGANGDSFFQSVTDKGDYVEIVLKDGTTFAVQKYDGTLSFSLGGTPLTDLAQTIDLVNGNLTYTPADAEVLKAKDGRQVLQAERLRFHQSNLGKKPCWN